MNVVVAASLNERGVNAVLTPLVIVFSGSLLPLDFFPDPVRPFLHLQPLAGLVDIPFRIYFGDLAGGAALRGLALQAGVLAVVEEFACLRQVHRRVGVACCDRGRVRRVARLRMHQPQASEER